MNILIVIITKLVQLWKTKKEIVKKRNFVESLTEEEIKYRKKQENEILNKKAKNTLKLEALTEKGSKYYFIDENKKEWEFREKKRF